jgi:GDP-4-dehydro-6-deoxy-D-mannose reductase
LAENLAHTPLPEASVPKKVLITGISGFVGTHLTEYLLANFADHLIVHGIYNSESQPAQVSLPEPASAATLHYLNLEDTARLTDLLEELRPDYIFHLAARSFVGPAISDPGLTLNTNVNITLNLFEAVRIAGLARQVRILNAGSSDQYGFVQPGELPVKETTPFRPSNAYAVSKIAQEMLGYQYFRSYKLHIVNTRAFNHVGPRQSPELAVGAFARQIALAEAGRIEPVVQVGNLDASRDFTDVRDIVRGYWLALAPEIEGYPGCQPGEAYNICSGRSYVMKDMLERLIKMARCPLQVQFDATRMRPSDVPNVRGDYSKFNQATGWEPVYSLEQSLTDLLNSCREIVRKQPAASSQN